jgi:membrane associated rhomboid family serine protease
MGLADRDYQREDYSGQRRPSRVTPVVKALLAINVALYFLELLILDGSGRGMEKPLREFGAFSIASGFQNGRVWELLTFQFLHGSLGHLAANSIGLFFFGPWMERWWGSLRFLAFYLLCGVAGALFYSLLVVTGLLPCDFRTSLVGASAGIYGIVIGVAVIAPDLRVRLLLPPVELSMRQLATLVMGFAVIVILLGFGDNEGGEAGHLGGAILGYLLVRNPAWLRRGKRLGNVEITVPKAFQRTSSPKLRPRSTVELQRDSEVDRILDKISSHGFQSLTAEERETLQNASKSAPKSK